MVFSKTAALHILIGQSHEKFKNLNKNFLQCSKVVLGLSKTLLKPHSAGSKILAAKLTRSFKLCSASYGDQVQAFSKLAQLA